jgi:hypothetical protein
MARPRSASTRHGQRIGHGHHAEHVAAQLPATASSGRRAGPLRDASRPACGAPRRDPRWARRHSTAGAGARREPYRSHRRPHGPRRCRLPRTRRQAQRRDARPERPGGAGRGQRDHGGEARHVWTASDARGQGPLPDGRGSNARALLRRAASRRKNHEKCPTTKRSGALKTQDG